MRILTATEASAVLGNAATAWFLWPHWAAALAIAAAGFIIGSHLALNVAADAVRREMDNIRVEGTN